MEKDYKHFMFGEFLIPDIDLNAEEEIKAKLPAREEEVVH